MISVQNAVPDTDIVKEAQRIIDTAEKNDITLRLLGGLAVRFHCPSATHRGLARKYADIDFMGLKKQTRALKKLFVDLGYTPRDFFNALQGDERLIFNDMEHGRRIDIFLDVFEMCHKLEFKDRLLLDKYTIPLADLLATKLQVVEITEREYRDIICILNDHEISDSDGQEMINGKYLAELCSQDWGIYKTFSINLANILGALNEYNLDSETAERVRNHIQNLTTRMENEPKSMGWTLRARIGEKKRWYELPERDQEVVDSRIDKASA